MIKRYIFSLFACLLCAGLCLSACRTPDKARDKTEVQNSVQNLTLCELVSGSREGKELPDEITVDVIVKQIFICPPCPENAECEYCPPDFILFENDGCSFKINPPEKQSFIQGKRYRLLMRKSKWKTDREDYLPYYIVNSAQR